MSTYSFESETQLLLKTCWHLMIRRLVHFKDKMLMANQGNMQKRRRIGGTITLSCKFNLAEITLYYCDFWWWLNYLKKHHHPSIRFQWLFDRVNITIILKFEWHVLLERTTLTCKYCSSAWPQPCGSQTACRIRHYCTL